MKLWSDLRLALSRAMGAFGGPPEMPYYAEHIRFDLSSPDETIVEVRIRDDAPESMRGWHRRTFPPDTKLIQIMWAIGTRQEKPEAWQKFEPQ